MPELLPVDQNGSLAATDAPLPPGSPLAAPEPQAPQPPPMPPSGTPEAPQAPQGAAPPNPIADLMQRLQENATRRKAIQDQLAAKTGPDGIASYLPNGGKVKPSDMLRDALYNFSQLNLRNPTYGVLRGHDYKPIQQQRYEQALQHNSADVQNLSLVEKTMADQAASDQFQLNQTRLQQQMQQQTDKAAQESKDRQAAVAQRDQAAKATNAYNYAKIAQLSDPLKAKADLDRARTEAEKLGNGNVMLGVQMIAQQNGWSMDDPKTLQLLRDYSLAKNPMLGAVTVRQSSRDVLTPDPNDPTKMVRTPMGNYSRSYKQPVPLPGIGLPGQDLDTQSGSPAPSSPSTAAPKARPSAIAPPPAAPIVNAKSVPAAGAVDKANKAVNQLDIAISTVKRLNDAVDKVHDLPTAAMIFANAHPDSVKGQLGAALMSKMFNVTPQQTQYISDWIGLKEYVNLLRSATNATGFRGPQGWNALQSLAGNPGASPEQLKAEWRNAQRDFLAQRAADYGTKVKGEGGVFAPDKDTIDAYIMANGGSVQDAKNMIRKHGYTGK